MSRRAAPAAAAVAILGLLVAACGSTRNGAAGAPLAYVLRPDVGVDECRDGDHVAITRVEGSQPEFVAGGTYRVLGTWTLASRDAALMELWVMNGETSTTPSLALRRGTGEFDFTFTMTRPGFPHVSLYPDGGGPAFAAVFFGTGDDSTWRTAFER